jgi:hypothetical protein
MATKGPSGEQYGGLEKYLRRRCFHAFREQLDPVDLYVALSPHADMRVQQTAKEYRSNASRVISTIVASNGNLLRRTMSEALRDGVPTTRFGQELLPSLSTEADNLARDLIAHLYLRKRQKVAEHVRRHFSIARDTRRLLRTVAGYHDSHINDIVETLIVLGLSQSR